MDFLLVIFLIVFIIAYAIGRLFPSAFFWNYVDIIYYPLAAIGVSLLFLSNETQRQLFEINQAESEQRNIFLNLQESKPTVEVKNGSSLLSQGLKSIQIIDQWRSICERWAVSTKTESRAVEDFALPVQNFLKAANQYFDSYEDRLSATCEAGDKLVKAIYETGNMSSTTADNFSIAYRQAIEKKLYYLNYEGLEAFINQFVRDSTHGAKRINDIAFKTKTDITRRLLEIELEKIQFGEMVLRGLAQCIFAPRKDLYALQNWKSEVENQSQELSAIQTHKLRLSNSNLANEKIVWIQLNLWPLILILALSLKFAKGSAALKKAKDSNKKAKEHIDSETPSGSTSDETEN